MAARNKPVYGKLGYGRSKSKEIDSLLSKLVPERSAASSLGVGNNQKGATPLNLSKNILESIAKAAGQDRIDSDSTAQVLPDIELTKEILVGSILSPKTLYDSELGIGVDDELFDGEVVQPLVQVITKFFKGEHKINSKLERWLEEMLFTTGGRPILILPENELDALINGRGKTGTGLEDYNDLKRYTNVRTPRGLLSSGTKPLLKTGAEGTPTPGLENYSEHTYEARVATKGGRAFFNGITVTDDFDVLKHSALGDVLRAKRKAAHYAPAKFKTTEATPGVGLEGRYTDEEIAKLYDKPTQPTAKDQVRVLQPAAFSERPSVGHPLYLELPIDCVVPVFPEGKPSEHLGYYVLLVRGKPMYLSGNRDYYSEIRQSFRDGQDDASSTIRQVREAIGGVPDTTRSEEQAELIESSFTAIMENDLRNRLQNDMYADIELDVSLPQELGRVMLWREMKNKDTQVLYVPAELMIYMAFDYTKQGTGRSLLSGSKIIGSMRSVLLFAETMAGVANAVGRKKVTLGIDGDDPDAFKSISDTKSLIFEGSRKGFPIGSPDPGVTMDYLDRAGYDFAYDISGENLPATKVSFEDYATQQTGGNSDLSDRLRRMHISGMKVNPELVDPTQSPEFAVSIVNNNVIMARNVLRKQTTFCQHVSRYMRTFTRHSSKLMDELLEAVKSVPETRLKVDNVKVTREEYVVAFVEALTASLPSPDNTKLKDQSDSYENYVGLLDKALDAYISPEALDPELLGADAQAVLDQLKLSCRNHYIRKWLATNGILSELEVLTEVDGKKPVYSFISSQKILQGSIGIAAKEYLELRKKAADEAEALQAQELANQTAAETPELGDGSADQLDDPTAIAGGEVGGGAGNLLDDEPPLGGLDDLDAPLSGGADEPVSAEEGSTAALRSASADGLVEDEPLEENASTNDLRSKSTENTINEEEEDEETDSTSIESSEEDGLSALDNLDDLPVPDEGSEEEDAELDGEGKPKKKAKPNKKEKE